MPSWLSTAIKINVNGSEMLIGTPGTYCVIDRTWKEGDIISYCLPMDFRVSRYEGLDTIEGYDRYAIECGPVLLGVFGSDHRATTHKSFDFNDLTVMIVNDPAKPEEWLIPVTGKPFHYKVKGKRGYEYMAYYEILDQKFTCYPIIVSKN